MDCQEVRELLDAYALGATEPVESEGLERHLSDCIRCWEELSEAQRTAAALSLAVGIEAAPARLRDRVLSQAEREGRRERGFWGIRQALGRGWPALAGAVAAAGVAALAFAAVLQLEVNDLRDENDEMAFQLQSSAAVLQLEVNDLRDENDEMAFQPPGLRCPLGRATADSYRHGRSGHGRA